MTTPGWEPARPPKRRFYRRTWFLVLVAMFILVVGIGSLLIKREWDRWDAKANEFDYDKLSAMESASIIYDRNGQVLGRIFIQNRKVVGLDKIASVMRDAVIAAEDARYFEHQGVDFFGIFRAMVRNYQAGRTRQGASTLTQQLARNSFPDELPSASRSYERKILEMAVAMQIEKRFSKEQIMGLYLNRVFFGSGFYGVEAASLGYFGKSADKLNVSEAAMLAGLLRSPNNLSPWHDHQKCIDSRNLVLKRMLDLKRITQQEYDATISQPLVIRRRQPIHRESYAADQIIQQVKKQVGDDNAVSEGYQIYTTIDVDLQKKAESTVQAQLAQVEQHAGYDHQTYPQFDQIFRAYRRKVNSTKEAEDVGEAPKPEYLQGAVVVLDNKTGGILALVGGRDISHSPFNRALSSQRPVGTAFKPLVYAAAFENGLFPGTPVQDAVIDNRQVMIGGTTGILGEWGPERVDNKYEGTISARSALVKSKNAATWRLGMRIGKDKDDSLDRLASLSKTAGIDSPVRPFPNSFLGSSEMTLMEMTLANTMFPSGGMRPTKTHIIDRIVDRSGKVTFSESSARQKVIRSTTAYEIHSCLSQVLEEGTADRTFTTLGLKRADLGGKTGTAYNFTDVWFVGYSSEVTCGVWAGFDKPRTAIYRGAFSNEIALPMWTRIMQETFAKYQPEPIPKPSGLISVEICSATGLLATPRCVETTVDKATGNKIETKTTYKEMCTEDQAPKDACDLHGGGTRTFVKDGPRSQGDIPRAVAVAATVANSPVEIKAPTVIGLDPYKSDDAIKTVMAMKALEGKTAPVDNNTLAKPAEDAPKADEPEVRKALPVTPLEQMQSVESPIKIAPPAPLEF